MKKLAIIALIVLVGALVGYILGTEDGRTRRDQLIAKVRKQSGDLADAASDAVDAATAAVTAD